MTRRGFNDICVKDGKNEAVERLSERILHNSCATRYIIRHCAQNNILHYRLSSALFPLITDDVTEVSIEDLPDYTQIKEELCFAGKIARQFNISIGSHPDQFNVLASKNLDAVDRTIKELNFQASVLDMLGLPQDHTAPMNIHINAPLPRAEHEDVKEGVDSESFLNYQISEVAENFYDNLMKCDSGVYNRLTIENEDRGAWNVDNIIKFSDYIFQQFKFNLPVCYDNLHDICNPSEVLNIQWQAERCAYTWVNQGEGENDFLAPVFHWSEGNPEKPRSHAEYFALGNLPPHIAIEPNKEVKWECEVKGKDKAIRLLRKMLDK
jgi:UV DNA damage repair endonuclease